MSFSLEDTYQPETALIVVPFFQEGSSRNPSAVHEEVAGLARSIQLKILHVESLKIRKIEPGAYFGKGQRQKISDLTKEYEPDVVIVNTALSPIQQRNLEKEWNAKVIDRTGLILEIFGARAQTKEGRLQVDLAALEYQKSRLVRSWTHLERQRGGAGFMGGPGERQIEIDRRLISTRITRLKKELEDVRRTRDLGRQSRERVPFPIIALVGYTNAGKSTLFNSLTDENVFAEDLPFATLDPTLRRLELPGGQKAILSDTVGFIADLPTHLIEAFRATLEQIAHADVIAHVMDISQEDYKRQKRNVISVLNDLGISAEDERIVEVWNKADLLSAEGREDMTRAVRFKDNAVLVEALHGRGTDALMELVSAVLSRTHISVTYRIPISDGKAQAWLHEHAEVESQETRGENTAMNILISPQNRGKFESRFSYEAETVSEKAEKNAESIWNERKN